MPDSGRATQNIIYDHSQRILHSSGVFSKAECSLTWPAAPHSCQQLLQLLDVPSLHAEVQSLSEHATLIALAGMQIVSQATQLHLLSSV
jgi:hypothetical protein